MRSNSMRHGVAWLSRPQTTSQSLQSHLSPSRQISSAGNEHQPQGSLDSLKLAGGRRVIAACMGQVLLDHLRHGQVSVPGTSNAARRHPLGYHLLVPPLRLGRTVRAQVDVAAGERDDRLPAGAVQAV